MNALRLTFRTLTSNKIELESISVIVNNTHGFHDHNHVYNGALSVYARCTFLFSILALSWIAVLSWLLVSDIECECLLNIRKRKKKIVLWTWTEIQLANYQTNASPAETSSNNDKKQIVLLVKVLSVAFRYVNLSYFLALKMCASCLNVILFKATIFNNM